MKMTASPRRPVSSVEPLARFARLAAALPLLAMASQGRAEVRAGLETGAAWQSRNDVRIPGDTGTSFSLTSIQGNGPVPAFRAWAEWIPAEKHGVRLTAAPLRVEGTGTLEEDVSFAGETFSKDASVKASYRFDTYRLTYRYRFFNGRRWNWRWGGTLLLRDAEIELIQEGRRAAKSNVGWVPLLHVAGSWRAGAKWRGLFELDGLAGGPGRAVDATAQGFYRLSDRWDLGGGYRTIEGGSDTDDTYAFAWFHILTLSAEYRF